MGTAITLDVGGVSLTYSKNHSGMDHGFLFQESDRTSYTSEQIDCEYYERQDADPTSSEMAFVRLLKDVVPRLELLGFTIDHVRQEYERTADRYREDMSSEEDEDPRPELMSFSEFLQLVSGSPLSDLNDTYPPESGAEIRGRFADVDVRRFPNYEDIDHLSYSERSFFEGLISVLHPYSVMRLLAENQENADASVVWQYGPLVDAGWAKAEHFVAGARRTQTFLIATEGTSDIYILRHALALLRPGIADFFRFIDGTERHPFSGTGSLVKFAEGLAKIDVHNQVLFLFDNDAEGLEAQQRLSKMTLPINMRGALLPEIAAFREFPAQGPDGLQIANINRRAAAIECYLDLTVGHYEAAKVLWSNYKKELGVFHGALEFKEFYTKEFLRQTQVSVTNGAYDVSKLNEVLNLLVSECTAIATVQRDDQASGAIDGRLS